MSATPLSSLPLAPAAQPASPQPGSRGQQHGASFNAHLQSAQQQRPASQDSQQTDAQQDDSTQANDSGANTTAQPGTSADAAKPGDSASNASQDESSNGGVGLDVTGAVGTLASVVLGLIDHATGDTHGGNTANPAPAKPAQPAAKQASVAQPAAPLAAMIPVPVVPANTAPTASTGANANGSANGSAADGPTGLSISPKASAASADFAAGAGDAGASNATPASADTGTLLQGATDSAQSFAGSLTSAIHAALPMTAAAATDNSAPSTPDLTALSSLTATAPIVPAAAGGTHNLAMNSPVGSSGFAKELGQQITWLSGQDVKQAQIRLNPQDLGPLDVKISVEHGRVDVAFMTQHPAATAAVQQGLDQLNQMLGGQGLSLGHATVGQHAQQHFGARQDQPAPSAGGGSGDEAADTTVATVSRVAIGLVDAFA